MTTTRRVQCVNVSTSVHEQTRAAQVLTSLLNKLDCPHVYIGGFAWSMLGSTRRTKDIDVLIQLPDDSSSIQKIRQSVSNFNQHFAELALKLYYVKILPDSIPKEEIVLRSNTNVLIETLETGKMGLPTIAGPVYLIPLEEEDDDISGSIPLLVPGVLILTKMKRWAANCDSTRPQTVEKIRSDAQDLRYMVYYMAESKLSIVFEKYKGKTKEQVAAWIRKYCDRNAQDSDLLENLRMIVEDEDWAYVEICPTDDCVQSSTASAIEELPVTDMQSNQAGQRDSGSELPPSQCQG